MADNYTISVGVKADFSDLKDQSQQGAASIENFQTRSAKAVQEFQAAAAEGAAAADLLNKQMKDLAAAGVAVVPAMEQAVAALRDSQAAEEADAVAAKAAAAAKREMAAQTNVAAMNMRVLEGSTIGSARAAGMFATQTLGLGSALGSSMAAGVFGAIALGVVIVDLGEKIFKAFDVGGKEAEKLREESLRLTNSMRLQNAEMHVTLDRELRAKDISDGKPFDGLRLSADEARVAVLRLNQQLATSADQLMKQLQDEGGTGLTGLVARMVGTKGGTGYEREMLRQHQMRMSDAATADYASGTNTMGQQLAESESYGKTLAARQRELQWRTGPGYGGESPAALPGLRDELKSVTEMIQQQKLEEDDLRTAIAAAKNEPTHAHNPSEGEAGGSSSDSRQMRADETALAEQKRAHEMSVQDEAAFWQKRLSTYKEGSAQYLEVLNRLNSLSAQAQREEARTRSQFVEQSIEDYQRKQQESERVNEAIEAAHESALRHQESDAAATEQSAQVQIDSAAKVGEARLQYQLTTGAISKHAYALHLAALHAKEYADKLTALNVELKALQALGLQGADTTTQQRTVQDQIVSVQGSAQASSLTDMGAGAKKDASAWQQTWDNTFQNATGSFSQAMGTWLTISDGYNTQFSVLMGRMMVGVVQQFASSMIEMGVQWTAHEAYMLLTHQESQAQQTAMTLAGNTARTTSTMAANAVQTASTIAANAATTGSTIAANTAKQASDTTTAMQSVLKHAASAAAGAWDALSPIPVVGPALGAAAAAATYAGVIALAAFEQGGIIPGSIGTAVPILGHAGEAVLPQPLTAMLTSAAQNGGVAGGVHYHDHTSLSAIDGASVAGMYRRNAAAARREFARQMRIMNKI